MPEHYTVDELELAYGEFFKHAYDAQHAVCRQETGVNWVLSGLPDMGWNLVCGGRGVSPVQTHRILDTYRDSKTPFIWLLPPDVGTELPRQLEQSGLLGLGEMPVMTAELNEIELDPYLDELEVRRVTTDADFHAWVHVCRTAFRMKAEATEALHTTFRNAALSRDSRARFYLGLLEGEAVGTALNVHGERMAGVWCVAVDPRFRRRGIGREMTVRPLTSARSEGYDRAMLAATPSGYPVYADIGFETRYLARVFGRSAW